MVSRLIVKYVRPIVGTKGDQYEMVYTLGSSTESEEYKLILLKEDLRLLIQTIDNAIL